MKKIHDNPNLYRYDITDACSATECTGLIPAGIRSEEEQESYDEIFHYAIPEIDKQ